MPRTEKRIASSQGRSQNQNPYIHQIPETPIAPEKRELKDI